MYAKEEVELFLLAREDGMTVGAAAEFAGVPAETARKWARGSLPRSYTGAPWGSGRIVPDDARATPREARSEARDQGAVRARGVRPARRHDARPDREAPAQGGVGRPKRGRLAPPFDPDAEQVRARQEIEVHSVKSESTE